MTTTSITAADLPKMTTGQLVKLFNSLAAKPVKRFADRDVALRRVAALLPKPAPVAAPKAKAAPKVAQLSAARSASIPREERGADIAPRAWDDIRAVKERTKTAMLIDMLARPEGATLEQLRVALKAGFPNLNEWQISQVRNAIGADVKGVAGYGVRSEPNAAGVHVYRIVLPKGLKAPLEHIERKMAMAA